MVADRAWAVEHGDEAVGGKVMGSKAMAVASGRGCGEGQGSEEMRRSGRGDE